MFGSTIESWTLPSRVPKIECCVRHLSGAASLTQPTIANNTRLAVSAQGTAPGPEGLTLCNIGGWVLAANPESSVVDGSRMSHSATANGSFHFLWGKTALKRPRGPRQAFFRLTHSERPPGGIPSGHASTGPHSTSDSATGYVLMAPYRLSHHCIHSHSMELSPNPRFIRN
ncbi:hypothetical protein BDR04DRAFT_96398 [Suillus decipiens]|nr:hypothetical protein BDR04DRAFT_96398 [Suillus decipiens]